MRPLLVSLLLLATAEPAMAFDCAKAAAPLDKAICAQPELMALDDAMAASYNRLRALLEDKDKQALLARQRIWLRQRAKNCVYDGVKVDRDCVAHVIRDRQAELANHLHGAEGAPRILPLYRAFTDKRQKYTIATATPVLSLADASRAALFNSQAQGWVAYEGNLKELEMAALEGGHSLLYTASYRIAVSSPELISIGVSSYRYLGGAHGQPTRMAFAYDPVQGRFFERGELFRDEPSLLAAVTDACRADLTRQHQAANNRLLFDDADPEPAIADFGNWLLTPGQLLIRFDVYTIAPYASGEIDCAIPVPLLAPFVKAGVRLP